MLLGTTEAAVHPPALNSTPVWAPKAVWPTLVPEDLPLEPAWRRMPDAGDRFRNNAAVLASRWIDGGSHRRRAEAEAPSDRYVLGIALRRTRIRLISGAREILDGAMAAGTVYVTGPSERLVAEFQSPCDFVHLYIAERCLPWPAAPAETGNRAGIRDLNGAVLRDPLAAQLARTLTDSAHAHNPLYVESIARTVLLRLAMRGGRCITRTCLPKWRLTRVQEYVKTHLASPISLADLAGATGLSRSYFAAQFRAATGCRPHEYVMEQRVERAQAMLAEGGTPIVEVALSVGFQTQAHFSTVFKRLTGASPARWRLSRPGRTHP